MIINIKNKNDLITIDLSLKQIRYLKDYYINTLDEIQTTIDFLNFSNDDCEGYEYLFKEDKKLFLKTLKEDLENNIFLNRKINIKDLEILK